MPQKHPIQAGIFHVTTNTKNRIPWCTWSGVPDVLIDNLLMTRNIHSARLYAFCILPNHVHILFSPGEKGLSRFIKSFKENSSYKINNLKQQRPLVAAPRRGVAAANESGKRRDHTTTHACNFQACYWQKGFYDERIQTESQCSSALHYILLNACKHRLVPDPLDWPWTSIHYQHSMDPMEIWL